MRFFPLLLLATAQLGLGQDALGLSNGYLKRSTKNFDIQIVKDAQTLASLRPAGSSFDFLPLDYLPRRARNGQHHWGDVTLRYREEGATTWLDANSAAARKAVSPLSKPDALSAASLASTLPATLPLNITREWIDISGDLGMRLTLTNTGRKPVEIGSLGMPAEFNSIFTGRSAEQIQQRCSLADPYVGMHGGYIRVVPVRGTGAALVVTPLGDTPFEAWRNLAEQSYPDTGYGSQTFEGYYEWQVLTKAWATKEWAPATPWNPPSSRTLRPGQAMAVGVRFSLAKAGVRDIDRTILDTGTPVVVGMPGYILPHGASARLSIRLPPNPNNLSIKSITSSPPSALLAIPLPSHHPNQQIYTLTQPNNPLPSPHSGRTTLTITYTNNHTQTIHYFLTANNNTAQKTIASLGRFLSTHQLFNSSSSSSSTPSPPALSVPKDPFNRTPSILTYDYETRSLVTQDSRVWIAGLSDEAGAGSYLTLAIKQAFLPESREISILEEFVGRVLWGVIQNPDDYSVKKSVFFYEPSFFLSSSSSSSSSSGGGGKSGGGGFEYDRNLNWGGWPSWNRSQASATDRAYNYVHVAAAYWALYRVGRGYPALLQRQEWGWYLDRAYRTVMRCMARDVHYNGEGLMGETVFGELLGDLKREGRGSQAAEMEERMRSRARAWDAAAVPFGSEMAWDSTGQEGVWSWSRYFGHNATALKTLNTVLGYTPTVPHWGWNGNARRYWDNLYGGKLQRIERQIHHYGSALNGLVLLSAFRSDPSDTYLLRAGYGGISGPLSNINADGFASASFHSWPDTLKWDGYSGDYGPGFVGLALGAGTYLVDDAEFGGMVAYGGDVTSEGDGTTATVTVQTQDAFRRRVFVGPLKLLVSVDAGVIVSFSYRASAAEVSVTLSQLEGGPNAASAVMWLEGGPGTSGKFVVVAPGAVEARRLGWEIPLGRIPSVVTIFCRAGSC